MINPKIAICCSADNCDNNRNRLQVPCCTHCGKCASCTLHGDCNEPGGLVNPLLGVCGDDSCQNNADAINILACSSCGCCGDCTIHEHGDQVSRGARFEVVRAGDILDPRREGVQADYIVLDIPSSEVGPLIEDLQSIQHGIEARASAGLSNDGEFWCVHLHVVARHQETGPSLLSDEIPRD